MTTRFTVAQPLALTCWSQPPLLLLTWEPFLSSRSPWTILSSCCWTLCCSILVAAMCSPPRYSLTLPGIFILLRWTTSHMSPSSPLRTISWSATWWVYLGFSRGRFWTTSSFSTWACPSIWALSTFTWIYGCCHWKTSADLLVLWRWESSLASLF